MTQDIEARINNLRRKMLVHSYLYYSLNTSIIDDKTFDKWAYQLVELQQKHPDIAEKCVYHSDFANFDGTTGFHLCRDEWVEKTAYRLLKEHEKKIDNN